MYRHKFLAGTKLSEIRNGILHLLKDNMGLDYSKKIYFYGFNASLGDLYAIFSLTGESDDEVQSIFGISCEENEKQLMELYRTTNNPAMPQIMCWHHMFKSFWFRDYETALKNCVQFESYVQQNKMLRVADIMKNVIWGISSFILSRRHNKKELMAKGEERLQLMKMYANLGNKWNAENKVFLMEAEYNFALGDIAKACTAYEQSIQSSREHKFIHEEALAHELYGVCCVELGDLFKGNKLLETARELYEEWGAKKKADVIFLL